MIAILCPSRSRADQCNKMINSAFGTSTEKILIYVAVGPSEFEHYQKVLKLPASDRVGVCMVTMEENLPTAHKWNKLAELALNQPDIKLFMLGADDMVFQTEGWDAKLIESYNVLENKIHCFALQDSRDIDGTPHVILTREWIEALSYFVCPIFLHHFIDTWTVEIAKANNFFTHLRDYKLAHIKPSDEGKPDETHSRIRQWGWPERDKWVAEKMAHVLEYEKFRLMNGGKPLMYGVPGA